jgi:hypothetical protein
MISNLRQWCEEEQPILFSRYSCSSTGSWNSLASFLRLYYVRYTKYLPLILAWIRIGVGSGSVRYHVKIDIPTRIGINMLPIRKNSVWILPCSLSGSGSALKLGHVKNEHY